MYIPYPAIIDRATSYQLKEKGRRFIASSTLPALADYLCIKQDTLKKKVQNRRYLQFYIPKPDGEKRRIETPYQDLKSLQGQLNQHFQAAYFTVRPSCAYGALTSTADEAKPRNIYTNALRHIGKKWLLNVDIRRFFPNISYDMVYKALKRAPFAFNANTAKCLALLATFEQRLPTGAPTSPILSNIVCLPLDEKLLGLSEKYGWAYTRFIDDLSFSGAKRFKPKHVAAIEKTLSSEGFKINTRKLAISRIKDKPEVTGLILKKKKPDIGKTFIRRLEENIHLYHAMTEEGMLRRQIFSAQLIQRFRRFLHGQLQFVKFVRGEGDVDYVRLLGCLRPRGY